jgi:quercetin dioxygenase-like cupin family protein
LHVAPQDLRVVRQGDLLVRFATLGPVAYVLAEVPSSGSAGTSLEQPCDQPHWALVVEGRVTLATGAERIDIPAGRAFHVPPGGPAHTLEVDGSATIAGFQPIEPTVDVSDARLRDRGFEPVAPAVAATVVAPVLPSHAVRPGEIRVDEWQMSGYVLARVRMGERSGYTAGWCDAAHWGVVTAGRLAIEWEHDVEVLSRGDVFHCPAGPPGHRIEAADAATFVDLTPVAAFGERERLVDWRRQALRGARGNRRGIAVTALG